MDMDRHHPLVTVMVQYSMAAAKAFTLYLLSAFCSLVHSIAIMITIESLDWIQSFRPFVFEWESFLFGAVFLTMEIDLGSMDPANKSYYITHLEAEQEAEQAQARSLSRGRHSFDKSTPHAQATHWYSSQRSSASTGSCTGSGSSSNASTKRVTFDEQVMVLGGKAAVANNGETVAKRIHIPPKIDINRVDPSVPLSASPTHFSPPRCALPPSDHPQHTQSNYIINNNNNSNNNNPKKLLHKIMHPHQHKRQQQLLQQQLQQLQAHPQLWHQLHPQFEPQPCSDKTASCSSSISSNSSSSSGKKSLAQRLGLKKKKHTSL
ncbi:hypothetical protein BGZ94_009429 [Podila epigama]|nr:hypothetical protein BGZ94_009429 [Podila epigama]